LSDVKGVYYWLKSCIFINIEVLLITGRKQYPIILAGKKV